MAIVLSTAAGFVVPAGYAQENPFAVKGVVADSSGAIIQQAEVVFKGELGEVVAQKTDANGSVNVLLGAGKYVVTISAFGFAPAKLTDFSVTGPTADAFRVFLKVDPGPMVRSDRMYTDIGVPTVASELPNIIKGDPTRTSLPPVRSVSTKRRSMLCLYLWRCSASQP